MATSTGDQRKAITLARGQGVTVHYMSKAEFREAVQSSSGSQQDDQPSGANLFHGWKKFIEEQGTAPRGSNKKKVECQPTKTGVVSEQERTIAALKRTLEVIKKRHGEQVEEADKTRLALQTEFEALKTQNSTLEKKINELQEANQSLEKSMTAAGEKLKEWKAYHTLLKAELESLRKSSSLQIKTLKETEEESKRVYKEQEEASKKAHDKLTKQNDEEIKKYKERIQSLERLNQIKDAQIDKCEKAAAESERGCKEQLEASQAEYKIKRDEAQSLKEEAEKFKAEFDAAMQDYKQQLETMDKSVKSLRADAKEQAELHEKDKMSKEAKISELTSNNKSLCNQVNEMRKASEDKKETIAKVTKRATREKMESEIEELTEEIKSQRKVNESLHHQLDEGLKSRNAMQDRIAFLEKKVQQIQAGSSSGTKAKTAGPTGDVKNSIESAEFDAPEDGIIELLSSDEEDEDHEVGPALKSSTSATTAPSANNESKGVRNSSSDRREGAEKEGLKARHLPVATLTDDYEAPARTQRKRKVPELLNPGVQNTNSKSANKKQQAESKRKAKARKSMSGQGTRGRAQNPRKRRGT